MITIMISKTLSKADSKKNIVSLSLCVSGIKGFEKAKKPEYVEPVIDRGPETNRSPPLQPSSPYVRLIHPKCVVIDKVREFIKMKAFNSNLQGNVIEQCIYIWQTSYFPNCLACKIKDFGITRVMTASCLF
jgi:hypothetical protein